MHPTELFVYGTLRHDQPEHARYCRGVTGWWPARLRAQLWMVPAGYRLTIVPQAAVLLTATGDAEADEMHRHGLAAEVIARAVRMQEEFAAPWIDGELLRFRDATEAWPPLDRWEEFTPGRPGTYARVVVPVMVQVNHESAARAMAVWAYVATAAPAGSVRIESVAKTS